MPKSYFYVSLFWCVTGISVCRAQKCGQPPTMENRIVGGVNAADGAWPWQVDIQTEKDKHVCGGTLISQQWVLSAAHCFPDPYDVSSYTVYVGRYQINSFNPHETSHSVARVVVPSGYVEPHQGRDVALVQLRSPVAWSEHVQPVCLPDAGVLFPEGIACYVTGWGNIRDGVELQGAGTLQEVQVPIISQASCHEMYQLGPDQDRVDVLYDMMCAGFQRGGKDSCQGDSGGPLVCQMVNGTWVQAGVVSFGLGCARPNRPGIYAKLSTFSTFIHNTVPELRLYGRAGPSGAGGRAGLATCLSALLITQLLK